MPKKKLVPGDFDLAVKRSSAGLGLFASEAIPKKACVIEYTGVLLTREQYQASNSRYLFDAGRNRTIDGAPRWNRARYINHSCRPNCDIEIQSGRVFIQARRHIRAGEELSYDYGKEYFEEYIGENCRCLKCTPVVAAKAVAQTPSKGKATMPKATGQSAPLSKSANSSERTPAAMPVAETAAASRPTAGGKKSGATPRENRIAA